MPILLSLAVTAVLQAATPVVTNADLRLVATAKPRVLVGESVTVRMVWSALRRVPVAPPEQDAIVLMALRARPIVLTTMSAIDPAIRAEAQALVRIHGRHRYLEPIWRDMAAGSGASPR